MFIGAHVLLYSNDAEADRAFLRDVLGLKGVDAGGGWLIFALPPAEVAVHPAEESPTPGQATQLPLRAELYFMCDDVRAYVRRLAEHGVQCAVPGEEPWGITTTIPLPSGGSVGLYQPLHPTALQLGVG
jgi:catechol 2,3-dioxygenase-like lactoylglutathione lyase family enzyme